MLEQLIEKANASLEFQSPLFIDYLTECLRSINALGAPISYRQSGRKQGHLLLTGEVGNGKSTTANYLMLNLEKRQGKNVDADFDMDQCFDARRSSSSVTKEVQQREFKEMVVIDTPGFNDSDNQGASDISISRKIIQHLLHFQIMQQKGLSSLVQCLMVPQSGRISHTSLQVMSRLLQSLTLSYETRLPQKHGGTFPLIQVLFTNFSRQRPKQLKLRRNLSNFGSKQGSEKEITFEDLCADYRQKLVEQLVVD